MSLRITSDIREKAYALCREMGYDPEEYPPAQLTVPKWARTLPAWRFFAYIAIYEEELTKKLKQDEHWWGLSKTCNLGLLSPFQENQYLYKYGEQWPRESLDFFLRIVRDEYEKGTKYLESISSKNKAGNEDGA